MENKQNQEFDQSLFEFVTDHQDRIEDIQGHSLSFWQDARHRFVKNKAAMVSLFIFIILLIMAFTAPLFGVYHNKVEINGKPYANTIGDYTDAQYVNLPPKVPGLSKIGIMDGTKDGVDLYEKAGLDDDVYFIFGTDKLGRDLYVRTMVGALISIAFGLIAALIDIFIGVVLGGLSGYYGGRLDMVLQRIVEVLGSVPRIIWVVLLVMAIGAGFIPLLVAMVISGWIPMYRLVRSQVMKLKEQEFVLSSLTLGGSGPWIIFKHLLPNTIGIIIIWLMFTIPGAIFFESFVSFLGMGISVPIPSLGTLANDGREALRTNPHILFAPALTLSIIMLTFNLMADGLRDAFDPKMRGGK